MRNERILAPPWRLVNFSNARIIYEIPAANSVMFVSGFLPSDYLISIEAIAVEPLD